MGQEGVPVEYFLSIFCCALFAPRRRKQIRFHDPFAFAPCFGSFASFSWPCLSSPLQSNSCLFFLDDEKVFHFIHKKTLFFDLLVGIPLLVAIPGGKRTSFTSSRCFRWGIYEYKTAKKQSCLCSWSVHEDKEVSKKSSLT